MDYRRFARFATLALALGLALPMFGFQEPKDGPLRAKTYRHPDLHISQLYVADTEIASRGGDARLAALASLGVAPGTARLDPRSGRWGTLMPAAPIVPGRGNNLEWADSTGAKPANRTALERAVWESFVGYVNQHHDALGIDITELRHPSHVTIQRESHIQINAPRIVGGVPVRGSFLTGVISQGNLTLFGAIQWGDINVSIQPTIDLATAMAVAEGHAGLEGAEIRWRKPHLEIIPMAAGTDPRSVALGQGYSHRLAWVLPATFVGQIGDWESLVDAHTGELLAFEDKNNYASTRTVIGGVFPISNDGVGDDGTEQIFPMPFADIEVGGENFFADSGGNLAACVDGTITTTLQSPYLAMTDTCGAINENTAADILDLGTSGGTDCTVPPGHSPGDTHASRSGFYEIGKMNGIARSYLPNNLWVHGQLPATMNAAGNCNAFGGPGGLIFFTSGGGCSNTGEIAGVFDHEWGHGMDGADANPGISSPGEGIADVYASLRLNSSCIGRNFRPGSNCGGYGDPCTSCTGVRDIDWANRNSGVPHDIAFIDTCGAGNTNGPCGGSVHCEGAVYAEAVWDLWNRDLPAAPFNMDSNRARELATKLTFDGATLVGTWFNCVNGSGTGDGCNGDGGYLNYLAADDDDGDLTNGTPHMTAINAAFARHGIACPAPMVQNSGCLSTPVNPPTVTVTPIDRGAVISWIFQSNVTLYNVYRAEGVAACDYGKKLVAQTTELSFTDTELANGREYYYTVIAVGQGDTCFGPASSCMTVTPTAGANVAIAANSLSVSHIGGDGDIFLDNCEFGSANFDLANIGNATLTNLRIDSVTSPSHPGIDASVTLPPIVSASLAACDSAVGAFTFAASGLAPDDDIELVVVVTADEFAGATRSATFTISNTESDLQNFPVRTFDFEADLDGWQVLQGTFNQTGANGGGDGTSAAVASSTLLDNQCDQIRSPVFVPSAGTTLEVWNNYTIEPQSSGTWYDRANVQVVEVDGTSTTVEPDGGRAYEASGSANYSGCNPTNGWASTQATWGSSTFSAAALGAGGLAGDPIQLDVTYSTDGGLALAGFSFDQVTLTNVDFQVADVQSNTCTSVLLFTDGFESGDTSAWTITVP